MAIKKKASTRRSKQEVRSGIKGLLNKSGAGVSALIPGNMDEAIANDPQAVIKELSAHFAMIPIGQIEANPDQPRREFEASALQELADSIKVHGIIQPITVRRLADQQYQIISGERRWRAAKIAGLEEIPAFIRIANDQTLMEMALIENIQREDLNAFEIAVSYYRLKDEFSFTDEQLADRVGKKRSTVTNYLRLLDLHLDVIDALKQGKLSLGHARPLAGIKDKLLQKKFLDEILEKNLSARQSEKLAKTYKEKIKSPAKRTSSRLSDEHQEILKHFREFFGNKKVQMQLDGPGSEKGQIVIPFDDNEQLNYYFKCVEQG